MFVFAGLLALIGAILLIVGVYRAFRLFDAIGKKFLYGAEVFPQPSYAAEPAVGSGDFHSSAYMAGAGDGTDFGYASQPSTLTGVDQDERFDPGPAPSDPESQQ